MIKKTFLLLLLIVLLFSIIYILIIKNNKPTEISNSFENEIIDINYQGFSTKAILNWPEEDVENVLLAFHGTTWDDSKTIAVTEKLVNDLRPIIDKKNLLIIGVAYPQENLLIGDNLKEAHASLLWLKNKAPEELQIEINQIYLFGHSLGGYLVTRLNTLEETDGVIANAPGPLDLEFRCSLIEKNKTEDIACQDIRKKYGSVFKNAEAYQSRSLNHFTTNHKSKIIFIQGLDDKKLQIKLWPKFKQGFEECSNCNEYEFLEINSLGHRAFFESPKAQEAVNIFLKK
jgi:hypothetical protein